MSVDVREDDKIPLSIQLFDGATNKYVKVILRDPDGVEITGSPVALSHIGEGHYTNDTIVMPLLDYITATYKVFNDSGFTDPSITHSDSEELYKLAVPVAELIEVLNKINQILSEGVVAKGLGYDLEGAIEEPETTATVDENTVVAQVEESTALGTVDTLELQGIIEDELQAQAELGCELPCGGD